MTLKICYDRPTNPTCIGEIVNNWFPFQYIDSHEKSLSKKLDPRIITCSSCNHFLNETFRRVIK